MEKPRNAVPMGNLVLDARILLIDRPVSGQESFAQALNAWQAHYSNRDPAPMATRENLEQFSDFLRELDPGFHQDWRVQVLKTYPWLDRLFQE
jgi:hypothetical protein